MASHGSVRSDGEVGQRRRPGTATPSVGQECLPCQESGLPGQRLAQELIGRNRGVEFLQPGEARRHLGIDDRVDHDLAMVQCPCERGSRPVRPDGVAGENIDAAARPARLDLASECTASGANWTEADADGQVEVRSALITRAVESVDRADFYDNTLAGTPLRPMARFELRRLIGSTAWPNWTPAPIVRLD